ncbi:ankyrin repeat-containing domain protein [Scheffersomyces xylosifermentans]|uniref:ankyrin repeat-containing domain protein n=1 Tax=Scheffersomyces xylosifermentans TaxID=1304137 RepID=UPI00315D075D
MAETEQTNKYAVHESIREGKNLLVKHLIDENSKLLFLKDEDERTPLHWACSMSNLEIVEYLLKPRPGVKEYDIDELQDASEWTPIHITASVGSPSILDLLMNSTSETPDIDLTTGQGTTALHLAISKNHYDLVKKLIIDYKCSCRIKDKKGFTPLHRAASIGSQPIVKLLVEKGKVNVNAKDNEGWTSLHHALAEGHGDVGALLVHLGADPTIVNDEGNKPIQVSVDEKVARFFKQSIEGQTS